MKSKLEIYALAVCFAAVVCLVISISVAGYAVIQIADPELTISSYNYDKYQTNDRYWEMKPGCPGNKDAVRRPSEEELTKQRLEALRTEIRSERRCGLQTLIHAMIFAVVGAVTLLLHWSIARKARA